MPGDLQARGLCHQTGNALAGHGDRQVTVNKPRGNDLTFLTLQENSLPQDPRQPAANYRDGAWDALLHPDERQQVLVSPEV